MLYLDTSVLVPLFVPEPLSEPVRAWFDAQAARSASATLSISAWTLTEFASAMGIKVREKGLNAAQAQAACKLLQQLSSESFRVFTPTRSAFERAAEYLAQHALGLRAGDALHLAIAQSENTDCFYTLDRRLIAAARRLKFRVESPI
jgi:uncharacterized protein